jgi:hypothetical protein
MLFKNNPFKIIYLALKEVFSQGFAFRASFFILTALFFFLFQLLQVYLVPGNSFKLQFEALRLKDYLIAVFLSAIISVFLISQYYLIRKNKKEAAKAAGSGGVGLLSAFFGGILVTAACSSCLFALFGFLGAGTMFFVLDKQPYVVGVSVLLTLVGLYFVAKKIQNLCPDCRVSPDKTR